MSLDELARAATRDVRAAAAARDAVVLRGDLDRRLARHRRHTVLVAAAVVLAIVLSGLAVVVTRRHDASAPPAHPRPTPGPTTAPAANGPIVVAAGTRLEAVDPATGQPVRLPALAHRVRDAYWLAASRDGSRLLVDQHQDGPLLYDLTLGTVRSTRWCSSACWPAWSPDGRTVAVTDDGELAWVDVRSGARRVLVPRSAGRRVADPSWSADGTRIAYLDLTGLGSLVVVDAVDGRRVNAVVLGRSPRVLQAAWSPDGTRIALLAKTGGLTADGRLLVEMLAVSGDRLDAPRAVADVGHCYCIGFAPGLAWSPDGRQLAVVTYGARPPAAEGLNVMAADGSGLSPVATTSGGVPAWLPEVR